MRKLLLAVLGFIVLFAGIYTYIKMNPSLAAYPSAYTTDRQIQLVAIGNRNPFGDIRIEEVLVNNNTFPSKAKVQVSNHTKGFTLSDGKEESEYIFKELASITLNPKTDPQKQLDKVNAGTAMEDDTVYALSVAHEERIDRVIIKYRHLGISRETIILTN